MDEPTTAGDFETFFRAVYPRLVRSLVLIVKDRDMAGELAQEAMARTLVAWDRLESRPHAEGFAVRTAVNLARSRWRRERRIRRARPEEIDTGWAIASADDAVVLREALGTLSDRQRACLALVDYLGLEVGDAAEVLGMRPSTVRVHLTRGRRRLANLLHTTYIEEV